MPVTKKPLLIITNLYPVPWGVNRASFNKQQFDLIAQSRDVKIVLLLPWKEWLNHRTQCQGSKNIKYCPYFYIPKFGRRFVPAFQFFSLLCFLPWIKKQQFSAILASWGFPDAVAVSMLNRFINLPLFVKVHGTDVNENSQFPARSNLMKKWLNKANTIFCASKALATVLQDKGIEKHKLSVNYNGVELDILGEGPMKAILADKIVQHGLSDSIRLLGSVPLAQVAQYTRQANFFFFSCYREGVPNVLLESFASATPVIATNVGGIPEVVNDDVGLLVEAKSELALAKAMEKAMNQTWSTEAILQHASKFSWQTNVQHVLDKMDK